MQINLKTSPVVFYGVKSLNFLVKRLHHYGLWQDPHAKWVDPLFQWAKQQLRDKLPEGNFLVDLHTFGFVNQIIPWGTPIATMFLVC